MDGWTFCGGKARGDVGCVVSDWVDVCCVMDV